MFAFPLRVGTIPLGTLTLYRHAPETVSEDALSDALILADITTSTM